MINIFKSLKNPTKIILGRLLRYLKFVCQDIYYDWEFSKDENVMIVGFHGDTRKETERFYSIILKEYKKFNKQNGNNNH